MKTIFQSLDAFIIICTITSSPVVPAPSPSLPVQSVPRALMNSIGGLLNNPLYSDVEFILSARAAKGTRNTNRKIWAMKRILMRADYFNACRPSILRGYLTIQSIFSSAELWICGSWSKRHFQ